jgi:hypothetical protein
MASEYQHALIEAVLGIQGMRPRHSSGWSGIRIGERKSASSEAEKTKYIFLKRTRYTPGALGAST